jgi:hypothetical protein
MSDTFDREQVRGWISECTGEGLSVDDPLPDTLASTAEAIGLSSHELRMWIFDHGAVSATGEYAGAVLPASAWTGGALVDWARRHGFAANERRTPA